MNRLQQLRVDALMSIDELATTTGVPATTIYNLERGEVRRPRMRTLGPLARHFDVAASTLLLPAADDSEQAAA